MRKPVIKTIPKNLKLFIGMLLFGTIIEVQNALSQDLDVPYVPTPQKVVQQMLDLADVQPSDYVIDLGSGDGRIVIAAAQRGASGHGVDLDPDRIAEARENASRAGVDEQIMFMQENIFDTDFSQASVVTMYLLPSVNKKLRPKLLDKLAPGTEIVSHSFDMGEWQPDKKMIVKTSDGSGTHDIYYWIIPAKARGNWTWSYEGRQFTMNITQQFQELSVNLSDGNGSSYEIQKAQLRGRRITVRASNGSKTYILSGRIEGNRITGMMQNHNGTDKSLSTWTATR